MRDSRVERKEQETMGRIRKLQATMKLYEYDVSSGYPSQTIYGLYERSYKPAAQEAEKALQDVFMQRESSDKEKPPYRKVGAGLRKGRPRNNHAETISRIPDHSRTRQTRGQTCRSRLGSV